MNKKAIITAAAIVGGVSLLGGAFAAVWNSRQMKMMRAAKRTGKILNRIGCMLQNLSGMTDAV